MTERPRVLVVSPDFPPTAGGIQLLVHRLVRHSERIRPRVVTLATAGDEHFDRSEGLDVTRVARLPFNHRAAVLGLNVGSIAEALRFRPHAVLSAHIHVSPASCLIAAMLGTPVVQYLYADEVGNKPRLTRFAVRQADATIAVSRHTEKLAMDAGAAPGSVHRIIPGVDLPGAPSHARATRPTVLTVARIKERYKGHDVMARAMALVRAQIPDAHWVVIGDGSLRPQVQELAAANRLEDAVSFVGGLADAERDAWLDCAHVFAMPSRLPGTGVGGEGFGIVYLEAGAHCLPVVAGNVAGALDAVMDGQTGLLVDPTDHVAVADAITSLLVDRERAEAFGRAGAAHAEQLTWAKIARRVEDVVLSLST